MFYEVSSWIDTDDRCRGTRWWAAVSLLIANNLYHIPLRRTNDGFVISDELLTKCLSRDAPWPLVALANWPKYLIRRKRQQNNPATLVRNTIVLPPVPRRGLTALPHFERTLAQSSDPSTSPANQTPKRPASSHHHHGGNIAGHAPGANSRPSSTKQDH